MAIKIDKTDELYNYLINLGADELTADQYYSFFFKNGYISTKDVQYFINYEVNGGFEIDYDEKILSEMIDYYKDIKSLKVPNEKEIKNLLLEYEKTKCEHCLEQIVSAYLTNVMHIAYCYKIKFMNEDINDILQVGNIGLVDAIMKFRSDARIDFINYVNFWVRHHIIKEFSTNDKGEING